LLDHVAILFKSFCWDKCSLLLTCCKNDRCKGLFSRPKVERQQRFLRGYSFICKRAVHLREEQQKSLQFAGF
jgi:hypothetical protein